MKFIIEIVSDVQLHKKGAEILLCMKRYKIRIFCQYNYDLRRMLLEFNCKFDYLIIKPVYLSYAVQISKTLIKSWTIHLISLYCLVRNWCHKKLFYPQMGKDKRVKV